MGYIPLACCRLEFGMYIVRPVERHFNDLSTARFEIFGYVKKIVWNLYFYLITLLSGTLLHRIVFEVMLIIIENLCKRVGNFVRYKDLFEIMRIRSIKKKVKMLVI